ncbi:hypothetical protein [Devosia riboflavina]|nr:hypothetical protein [Devosia riboflavina]
MTLMYIYAFIVMPVVVVAIGATGAWLHLRDLKRHSHHPAE